MHEMVQSVNKSNNEYRKVNSRIINIIFKTFMVSIKIHLNLATDHSYLVLTGISMEALCSSLVLITWEQIKKSSQNWTTQSGSAAKNHPEKPSSFSQSFLSLAHGVILV